MEKSIIHKFWSASPSDYVNFISRSLKKLSISKRNKLKEQIINIEGIGEFKILAGRGNEWRDILQGNYEVELIGVLNELKGKNVNVVWDIGAHYGLFSIMSALLFGKKVKIFAFEPDNYNFNILRKNTRLNSDICSAIKEFDFGISDKQGNFQLKSSKSKNDLATSGSYLSDVEPPLDKSAYSNFYEQTIRCLTIDYVIEEKIADKPQMVKIDVEGAEYLVLKGGEKFLKSDKPILIIEIHNMSMMFKVKEYLTSLGYLTELKVESKTSNKHFIIAK